MAVFGGLFALLFAGAINADEFAEANNILSSGDSAGKTALGTLIKWVFAVALPILCIGAGTIMAYSQQKKKAEQDQDTKKIYIAMLLGAVAGFFVYVMVAMIVSRALFGDAQAIFGHIDFVDAIICAKCKLQGYKKLSFDKDLKNAKLFYLSLANLKNLTSLSKIAKIEKITKQVNS